MKLLRTQGKQAFVALLCLSLVIWSIVPAASHAPAVFETIHDHLEMIADHGHSHGFEDNLYWAMHGHGHDAADHDHSQALMAIGDRTPPASICREASLPRGSPGGSHRSFRIDRPPRA